jgi:hypothetical protein
MLSTIDFIVKESQKDKMVKKKCPGKIGCLRANDKGI